MGKQYIDYLLVAIERNSLRGKLRRSLLIILLSLLTVETSHAQVNSSSDRPKVAVVLSGGGAKGVAHIGALKVIEEAGIPVDIICGTSMGALIGGLYSIGWTTEQLDSLVRAQDWTFLLSDRTDPARLTLRQRQQQNTYALIRGLTITDRQKNNGGLIRGRNLMTLFRQLCTGYLDSMSFDELPIPFACVATDIATNTEVDFHSGSLTRAMRSSMAIPGVFTPVRMDTMVLVDGGLRNNYPADLAREMGADIIIGVSVQGNSLSSEQLKDAMSIFEQIIDINCKNKVDENVKISDIYIEVPVDGYSAASFYAAAIDTLLHRGEAEARTHWAELVSLRDRYHLQRAPRPAKETEKPVDKRQPRPEPIPTVHIGFRFDSEEMGTVQLGVGIPFHTRIPTELRASLRLGRRIVAHAEYSLFPHSFTSPTLAYTLHRNDFDVYLMGDRIVNLRYNLHQTDFIPINTRLNKFNLTAGLRWDYFHYRDQMLSTLTLFDDPKDQHTLSYRGEVLLNTENEWYFPSRGINFQASYAYITDNLVGYDGGLGLTDIAFHWRFNIPVGRRFSLQPMLYGRLFFGSEQPLPYATTLGTEWFGQYTATQMPFDGVRFIEYIERHLLAFRLQMQYRLLSNHYVQLRLSAGATTNDLGNIPFDREHTLAGGSLAYFYNTIFGPLGFTVGYCNRIDRPVVYITLGHRF